MFQLPAASVFGILWHAVGCRRFSAAVYKVVIVGTALLISALMYLQTYRSVSEGALHCK